MHDMYLKVQSDLIICGIVLKPKPMIPKTVFQRLLFVFAISISASFYAQVDSGVYFAAEEKEGETIQHKLTVSEDYIIHIEYQSEPAKFIRTRGGFYTVDGDNLNVKLEFNSGYEADSVSQAVVPYKQMGDKLVIGDSQREYTKAKSMSQDLDGNWLFGTRGPDTGQERRGDSKPRKTLKMLIDGSFQWIAYNTETFKFFGSGGGSYTSTDGTYTESIEFFSRDNSRVGADLEFKYEVKGNDWHHTGNNSKGEPMYEIWVKR